jgi:hypothetical protein
VFGAGNEIAERIVLVFQLARLVPAPPLFLPAANMRDGIDEAAVNQRQNIGVEARRNADAIGAIAVKPERCAAFKRR